jgi:hypothetical protein
VQLRTLIGLFLFSYNSIANTVFKYFGAQSQFFLLSIR